jgi:hypothetical protein
MSLHTKVLTSATTVLAVLACTIVSLDLPTLLDFTGMEVEMLRSAILIVPCAALLATGSYALDLIGGE